MENNTNKKLLFELEYKITCYDQLRNQYFNECKKICKCLKKISLITGEYTYKYRNEKYNVSVIIKEDFVGYWVGMNFKEGAIKPLDEFTLIECKEFLDISPRLLEIADERITTFITNQYDKYYN